jgi:uncharacterized membrane protein YsdA (DUF1294 family)/cold shock CspA family protein
MRSKGKISSWNDTKGYGFITTFDDRGRIFVHIKAFRHLSRRPEIGQVVTYTMARDSQGRPCATQALLAGDSPQRHTNANRTALSTVGALAFLLVIATAVALSKAPAAVIALYLFASAITFIVYAIDKAAARKGGRRTPENTLHLLSLLGGWPGALLAQKKFRHKSKKQPFRKVFWATVLINCAALVWSLTPSGATALRSLMDSLV